MTLAYFDCFSGISGDMTLGALTALGVPVQWLQEQIAGLPLDGFSIESQGVDRNGIHATQIEVRIQETHHHRDYAVIRELIENCSLSQWVRSKSLGIFDRIATAEAAIHGVPKESVHFHEVGSLDAIVDVVGACLCLEYLGIERIEASPLPLGTGFVQCQHGTLPVPAPATLEIVKGIPVHAGRIKKEMVTPTGAAIIAESASSFGPMPALRIDRIGYGAGTRELENQPNLLRVILGRSDVFEYDAFFEKLAVVASNIDDMNPELFGYLMEKLFEDGALDVFWVPVHMKKNRPGTMVQVICEMDKRDRVVERILSETTSLGVRFHEIFRTTLRREIIKVETQWGEVEAKKVIGIDGLERIIPEFDVCARIARDRGIALRSVYEAVLFAAGKNQADEMI